MIARTWHGAVRAESADAYHAYLLRTGLADYRSAAGNRGVLALRRTTGEVTHYLLVTLWDDFAAIHAFAGDDIERARYYPEDEAYLLELERYVTHYGVPLEPTWDGRGAVAGAIARLWHGWTEPANADAYEALLRTTILPGIAAREIAGYRGITLFRRDADEEVEFVTSMVFDDLDAVRTFAGADFAAGVVPESARRLLARFDARSRHYEILRTGALRQER